MNIVSSAIANTTKVYLRLVGIVVFLVLILSSCQDSRLATAQQGILDVTQWDFSKHENVPLNGEWEFYWNQLLEPKDISDTLENSYISLPGVWNDHKLKDTSIQGKGYATFRLTIKTRFKNEKLGMRIPFHFTAYKLWVNEKLIASNGRVGKTQDTATPQTLPSYVYFEMPDDDLIVTLQVSNFHFNKGGAPALYKLGPEKSIRKMQTQNLATDLFLTGSLFIMAIYHLGLFLLRRKEVSTLYFCFVCFLIMIRTICLSETFLIVVFPDFDFEGYIKLVFISLFIGPSLFILFIESLFPEESIARVGKVFLILGILFSGSLIFSANVSSYVSGSLPFLLFFASSLIYELYILIKASLYKREGALLALTGMIILTGTALNDILFDAQVIITDYYTPYGLFVFVFVQSFLLSMKFSKAFSSVENLSVHITQINKANTRFVPNEFLSFLGKKSIIDVQLGDHVIKDMTIFFADIRSFTTISEKMTPEENFVFINSLLKRVSPIIRNNQGFIDKFMGDSIMALFPGHPKDALLAASQILKELERYNATRIQSNLIPVNLGIGINVGTLMLGTIGEEERMEGTVISDAVNLASRLEGLTKVYGANVIVSESVLGAVKNTAQIDFRFLGNVPIKGKAEAVSIYDVFSFDSTEGKTRKLQTKVEFEEAVELYQSKLLAKSKILFENVLKVFPDDKASLYYLEAIKGQL